MRLEKKLSFKKISHKKQYEFNEQVQDKVESANTALELPALAVEKARTEVSMVVLEYEEMCWQTTLMMKNGCSGPKQELEKTLNRKASGMQEGKISSGVSRGSYASRMVGSGTDGWRTCPKQCTCSCWHFTTSIKECSSEFWWFGHIPVGPMLHVW